MFWPDYHIEKIISCDRINCYSTRFRHYHQNEYYVSSILLTFIACFAAVYAPDPGAAKIKQNTVRHLHDDTLH